MEDIIKLHDKKFRIMIPAAKIDEAVACRINEDYRDKETPLFVGVLNGSFMFMSDLIKKIEFNNELSFVKLASYEGTCSTGCVKNLIGLNNSIEGRHVIIVEDIVDTGHTMDFLMRQFRARGARSLRLAVLIDKNERREVAVTSHFVGFALPGGFIVGYGLDYAETCRELPALYEAELEA